MTSCVTRPSHGLPHISYSLLTGFLKKSLSRKPEFIPFFLSDLLYFIFRILSPFSGDSLN